MQLCDKKHLLFYKKFENNLTCVLEKILKGNLDLISSPSLKIQIIGEKVCLRCTMRKNLPKTIDQLIFSKFH